MSLRWSMLLVVIACSGGHPPARLQVPGAPTDVSAVAGNAEATLSWTAPSTGGAVTSYTVTAMPGGATTNTSSTSVIVSGLSNGTSYTFVVVATNAAGDSPPSEPSNSVTPQPSPGAGPPGAPTDVMAIAGAGQATVSWVAANDNGDSITAYTVTSNPGGITAQAPLMSAFVGLEPAVTATVTGLTNGVSYTFTVTATNGVGTGPSSLPSNAVIPAANAATPPGSPGDVTAIAGVASATVTWTTPTDTGGAPIDGYAVSISPPGTMWTVPPDQLERTVTGLDVGVTRTFLVSAHNSAGYGPAVLSNPVTPVGPADLSVTFTASPATVFVNDPVVLKAQVSDVSGQAVPGVEAAFVAQNGAATVRLASITNTRGVAETFLTPEIAGTWQISGEIGATQVSAAVSVMDAPACPTSMFSSTTPVSVGSADALISAAVGDFNADGFLDVATASASGSVAIWPGKGDGTFGVPAAVNISGNALGQVVVADLNGDGLLDLAVLAPADVWLGIGLGNGDGTVSMKTYDIGGSPTRLAFGDFDGDGVNGVAVLGSSGTVEVWASIASALGPVETNSYFADPVVDIAAADLNGDGFADLVLANSDGSIDVITGMGNGYFNTPVHMAGVGQELVALALADFNGDNIVDAAAADASGSVVVLPGDGLGNLGSPTSVAIGTTPAWLVAGDFNGDGHADLGVADASSGVSVLLGQGDWAFQAPIAVALPNPATGLAAGDLSGDGRQEIIAAESSGLAVFRNRCSR